MPWMDEMVIDDPEDVVDVSDPEDNAPIASPDSQPRRQSPRLSEARQQTEASPWRRRRARGDAARAHANLCGLHELAGRDALAASHVTVLTLWQFGFVSCTYCQ